MSRNVICICVCTLMMAAAAGAADPPEPYDITVVPCDTYLGVITCPFPAGSGGPEETEFTVTIRWNDEPLPGLWVEVEILGAGHTVCPDAVLTGITDDLGQVTLNVAAGGCSPDGPATLRITANAVVIRDYHRIVSPDQDADGKVGLSDFVYFGTGYGGFVRPCTDYNNDGTTSLADFTIFAACFGRECEE